MDVAVVIVAAGRGMRAGRGTSPVPKQYRMLGGHPVLTRTLRKFLDHPGIGQIVTVIHDSDVKHYRAVTKSLDDDRLTHVSGGANRQDSVAAGLGAFASSAPQKVLIHDGVRPFISAEVITRVIEALVGADAVLPAIPLADTLKRIGNGKVLETLNRTGLVRAQTPQGFRFGKILAAHEAARMADVGYFTDDTQLAQWHGLKVVTVEGEAGNIKLTTPEDFDLAERTIHDENARVSGEWRSGHGSDAHRFGDGDHVMLCGVRVAHEHALLGHSDADVGLHALTDALLGALGEGDIGTHFPPSDVAWAGVASDIFLADAAKRVRTRGGRIANVDVTLICEAPKIGPHREAMRRRVSEILGLAINRVSVKATTTEGLGFTGRGEGIFAHASVSVWLPQSMIRSY